MKSHKKGLITKEYIVTNTHLNFTSKPALNLHFSTLSIKLFDSRTKLVQVAIVTTAL